LSFVTFVTAWVIMCTWNLILLYAVVRFEFIFGIVAVFPVVGAVYYTDAHNPAVSLPWLNHRGNCWLFGLINRA
jgi:hypothetical protein